MTGYTFDLEVDCSVENPNILGAVVDEVSADFLLPLYDAGSVPAMGWD